MGASCFFDIYKKDIAPKLRDIDIVLKTSDGYIGIAKTEELLDLPVEEIQLLMKERQISKIDKKNFLEIMRLGSSPICRLYQRELECGSPYIYKKSEISYIYGIDLQDVTVACRSLGIEEITSGILPVLFARIKTAGYKFHF